MTADSIPHFNDGFTYTAPVGTFLPNASGIYDLSGNVQEWVEDNYSATTPKLGVLRGGGWKSYAQENLYSGSRNPQAASFRDDIYGFRVVLVRVRPAENPDFPAELPQEPTSD